MKLNLNTILWLAALMFLFIAIVFFSTTLRGLPSLWPNLNSPPGLSTNNIATTNSNYTGMLRKAEAGTLYGTHVLLDKEGAVLVYLQSRKIDLKILEGSEVVVEGQRQRIIEAGIPLISVERVSFR